MVIVYSNLGIGGMPVRIIDLVNSIRSTHPHIFIHILLKERRKFDLRSSITNPNVRIYDFADWCPIDSVPLFILWTWYNLFILNPKTILTFISPYALPVLATRVLFFWRKTIILVNEGHTTSTMIGTMVLPSVQKAAVRLLYPLADKIIVPTNAVAMDLMHKFQIPIRTITIIPNWSRYALKPLGKVHKDIDIIYVGRFDASKNIPSLLRVMNFVSTQMPKIQCFLIGEGSSLTRCTQYISKHNLQNNIHILPPTRNVSDYLRRSKIFLFHPDASTEGFPVSVLDAMSCGAFVLSVQFNGCEEVLHKSYSEIVTSEKHMKNRALHIISAYDTYTNRIRGAKKQVQTHYSTQNIQKYISLMRLT